MIKDGRKIFPHGPGKRGNRVTVVQTVTGFTSSLDVQGTSALESSGERGNQVPVQGTVILIGLMSRARLKALAGMKKVQGQDSRKDGGSGGKGSRFVQREEEVFKRVKEGMVKEGKARRDDRRRRKRLPREEQPQEVV